MEYEQGYVYKNLSLDEIDSLEISDVPFDYIKKNSINRFIWFYELR